MRSSSILKALFSGLLFLGAASSVLAADLCAPAGWCTQSGGTTGGGNLAPITVTTLSALQTEAASGSARVIYVSGTMGAGVATRVQVASNKTIFGLPGATLVGGFDLEGANIILRNMRIQGPGAVDVDGVDCVSLDGATRVWLDHLEIWDGQDGNLDIVNGSNLVCVTWCRFRYTGASQNHQFCNLVGNSDSKTSDRGLLKVTWLKNWWDAGCRERMPRLRFGQNHVVNNLFNSVGNNHCVRAGIEADLRIESNVFRDVDTPIDLYENNFTGITALNNSFINCTGNTGAPGNGFTPPYTIPIDPVGNIEAEIRSRAGATLSSPNCGGAANTPTRTNTPPPPTPTRTSTRTNTPMPPTSTPTRTSTRTNTPLPPTSTATRTSTPVPPTATSTRSMTSTATPSRTATASSTLTRTSTAIPPTATSTVTRTATSTNTSVSTSTSTSTRTSTSTAVPPTFTSTSTATSSRTSTASATLTPTATSSASRTATSSATLTATPTSTNTGVSTATRTATSSATSTASATESSTPSSTRTASATPSATSSRTSTTSSTPTSSLTATAFPTLTTSPTSTSTLVFTPTSTATLTASLTRTVTASSTATSTSSVTSTASSTPSTTPTSTATSTLTFTRTASPTSTATSVFTPTATLTRTVTSTSTATVTSTQTATNTATSTLTSSRTATPSLTSTQTASPTWSPTATSTSTATASATASPTVTVTFTPTMSAGSNPVVFPNPVTSGTVALLPQAHSGAEDVMVCIYTAGYKLVVTKHFYQMLSGQLVQVALVDNWGQVLADGVYYLAVTVGRDRKTTTLVIAR